MPARESDPEDPLELNGAVVFTDEDLDEPMAETFIEEFFHLGWTPERILALFRHPGYLGPHRVWLNKGEDHVRRLIDTTLAPWKRPTPPTSS